MTTMTAQAAVQTTSGVANVFLASGIAQILIAISILILAVLAIIALWRWNQVLRDVRSLSRSHIGPVSDRARAIADNVEFITQALRHDVEKLNDSVTALTERLHLASERMEDRIEEFNALMEVVQGEAEEMFLDTASTVRGVREGARAIADRAQGRPIRGSSPPTRDDTDAPLAERPPEPEREVPDPSPASRATAETAD